MSDKNLFEVDTVKCALIVYKNYKGNVSQRVIRPSNPSIGALYYGTEPPWHNEPQWLLRAYDFLKRDIRTFALSNVVSWTELSNEDADVWIRRLK